MSVDFVKAVNGGSISAVLGGGTTQGTIENVRDGDTATSYTNGGSSGGSVTLTATFSQVVSLTSLYVKALGSGSSPGSGRVSVTLKDSGGGVVATVYDNTVTNGSCSVDQTFSGSWANVKSMVVFCSGGGVGGGGGTLHEMTALGPDPFVDIGLRCRVGGVSKVIACETLNGHQVRVRKGSTTYGIKVVDTSDSNASPIRVRIGSTTKALRYV